MVVCSCVAIGVLCRCGEWRQIGAALINSCKVSSLPSPTNTIIYSRVEK